MSADEGGEGGDSGSDGDDLPSALGSMPSLRHLVPGRRRSSGSQALTVAPLMSDSDVQEVSRGLHSMAIEQQAPGSPTRGERVQPRSRRRCLHLP